MPGFRILSVDGEESARRQLRGLLALDPECRLIGECLNGADAVSSVSRMKPDILFVDVRIPELDGFEVLRALSGRPPLVILTSGDASCYGRYAVRAFEAQVFDYLLKPLDQSRFHDALGRAKAEIARDSPAVPDARLLELMENLLRSRQSPQRIAVRQNGRVLFITPDEIDWIEAADNYVCLHCGGGTHLLRETMNELEARLDPASFIRIHRSTIVNIDRIKELQPWFRGDYRIILRDGTELTLTKNHRDKLESQLLLGSFAG